MNILKVGSIVLTVLGAAAGIGDNIISKKLQDEKIEQEVAKQITKLATKD